MQGLFEMMRPSLLRGAIYLGVLGLGSAAAWAAAAGVGTYVDGVYTVAINVNTLATYAASMIVGGGTALTALIKGWGK